MRYAVPFNPHANGRIEGKMVKNMVRTGVRMVRDKRRGWLAGRRMSERTTLRQSKPP